jgi:predicted DNA-binding transcriptional regulator AlpA
MDPYPGKALLTPTEVYKLLGVSKGTFYSKVRKDASFPLPVSLAGLLRFRKEDVLRYLNRLPDAQDNDSKTV